MVVFPAAAAAAADLELDNFTSDNKNGIILLPILFILHKIINFLGIFKRLFGSYEVIKKRE